jgi:outer membrane protein TolC|tara:strand:+ start:391 stop:1707 length:1317 start_codon:yes stop_codon:yes gene_type:complete
MWRRNLIWIVLITLGIFSNSQTSLGISDDFLRLISSTTLEQEPIYEAEKKIIEAIQDRKVDESDYKPIVEGEFTGSLLLYDNFRKSRGLPADDKHDFSLTSILKVYDFGRKDLIYQSADKSIEIQTVNLNKIKNREAERLYKIMSDYDLAFRKMKILNAYENFLNSQGEKIRDKYSLGGGTILELNQFEQLVNGFILQKQSVARDLRDAKAQYNLYYSLPFRDGLFPLEAELAARAYNLTGDPFNSLEYNIEEILLDLEIRKSRLEQSVSESEMFPDLTLGLKLTKFDVVSTGNDFEVRATATSKINIFDGFRRKYTVRGQSERIAALAAQLRNAKLLKDQRLSQYLIQYQNLGSEAVVEVEKKQKSKKDWDIAREMSEVTALDLGTEIRYASSILASELRLMDIEAEKGMLLIQALGVQGKLSEYFKIPDENTEIVY